MRRETPSEPLLTFPWNDRRLSLWRLLPTLLISVFILTLLAIVFKIKAPPPARSQPLSQSILILDPTNPVNQIVLNRAQDRSALILGPEAIDEISPGSPLLPVFRPSFTGYELKLKPPYVSRSSTDQPRLFQSGDLALPSNPPTAPPPPPDAASTRAGSKNWQLVPELHGTLARRPLRTLPDLATLRPQDLAKLRFQIAIKPNGRPLLIIPLHSGAEDREIVPALQTALSGMLFAPVEGSANEWGQISFAWTSAQPTSP
jgi:hypothetical protein